jgi:cystathionine beta-lyase
MEAAIKEASDRGVVAKAVLISSPHNPCGRVWRADELDRLDALCAERGLFLLSDEIHADICFPPRRHACVAGAARNAAAKARTLLFSGPNKTFNIAGLHLSHVVCQDQGMRARLLKAISANGYSQPNAFSIVAALAAYRYGGPWLDALLGYLGNNMAFLVDFMEKKLPDAKVEAPEGTYLAWVDCSALIERLGLADDRELVMRLTEEARVRLSAGSGFGVAGSGFVRINVACPRAILAEGLSRMADWAERASRSPRGSRA